MNKLLLKFLRSPEDRTRQQKGQVLILVTLAIVGLVAIIGLALDVGITFVEYARLRRAVDSAALAAALQFRQGATAADLGRSAKEFLTLNGVNDPSATVDTCASDATLCTVPERKLVRVTASGVAKLAFLPVIGISQVPLTAMAVSETASVDLVLVIDTSESMTFGYPHGDKRRDPHYCNAQSSRPDQCEPFQTIKEKAKAFVDLLYFPYDRVAIIDFNKTATVDLHLSNDPMAIKAAIDGLMVYEGTGQCPGADPCRRYTIPFSGPPPVDDPTGDPLNYNGFNCTSLPTSYPPYGDPENCTTTNTGDGLQKAGNEFVFGTVRQDALWVVLLLTDGAANSGGGGVLGFACPPSTWPGPLGDPQAPFCRDPNAADRHCTDPVTQARCVTPAPGSEFGDPELKGHGVWPGGGAWDPADYDAMDYARDMADFVYIDQHATIYTIGLGPEVTSTVYGDPDAGERFLKYAARDQEANGGLYFYAPSASNLTQIFQQIADNIATRLRQ